MAVAMAAFAVYFSWLSGRKAEVFDVLSLDLANMWQSMWNVAHGQGFVFSFAEYGQNINRLGVHADLLLILISPLTWLTADPRVLLWLQAVAVAAGAGYLYRLARHWLQHPWLAVLFGAGYLLYGPLQFAVVWQFHAETLAVTFILAMIEAMVARRRPWVCWLWFGLALISKEHVGLLIGPAAWWFARRSGWGRRAWWPWAAGWIYVLVMMAAVIPWYSPEGRHFVWDYYFGPDRTFGQSPTETNRLTLNLANLVDQQVIGSAVHLLAPVGLLPLASPLIFFAGLALLPHWLSNDTGNQTIFFHNHVLAIPFIWLATVHALRFFKKWLTSRWSPKKILILLTAWLAAWSTIGLVAIGPNPWNLTFNPRTLQTNQNLKMMTDMKKIVPTEASVTYAKYAGAWWRDRLAAWPLPYRLADSDYIVMVAPPSDYQPVSIEEKRDVEIYRYYVNYLEQTSAFAKIYDDGHNQIYRRIRSRNLEPITAEYIPHVLPSRFNQ